MNILERVATVERGLGPHGDVALRLNPPRPGERVLDVGCGFGDSTRQIGRLVSPGGWALGVDAAQRFIETARVEAEEERAGNVEFRVADVEAIAFEERFDMAFSRFGTMFFAHPVAALRNVRAALVPGGRLCMVVWRCKHDNPWVHRAEQIAEQYLSHPDQTDEPTCGPGPFSMAGADTVTDILQLAGFTGVSLRRSDMGLWMAPDLDTAVAFCMALGPAGELVRVNGPAAEPFRARIEAEIRAALADGVTDDGVRMPSSVWIVTATAP